MAIKRVFGKRDGKVRAGENNNKRRRFAVSISDITCAVHGFHEQLVSDGDHTHKHGEEETEESVGSNPFTPEIIVTPVDDDDDDDEVVSPPPETHTPGNVADDLVIRPRFVQKVNGESEKTEEAGEKTMPIKEWEDEEWDDFLVKNRYRIIDNDGLLSDDFRRIDEQLKSSVRRPSFVQKVNGESQKTKEAGEKTRPFKEWVEEDWDDFLVKNRHRIIDNDGLLLDDFRRIDKQLNFIN